MPGDCGKRMLFTRNGPPLPRSVRDSSSGWLLKNLDCNQISPSGILSVIALVAPLAAGKDTIVVKSAESLKSSEHFAVPLGCCDYEPGGTLPRLRRAWLRSCPLDATVLLFSIAVSSQRRGFGESGFSPAGYGADRWPGIPIRKSQNTSKSAKTLPSTI